MSSIFQTPGSITQPNFSDVLTDLSAANLTIAVSGMGFFYPLYTSGMFTSVTLPPASGLVGPLQRQVGFSLPANNPPVAVFNGGTPGTDPCLEAVLGPGAVGRMSAMSTVGATGIWAKNGENFLPGFPWPTTSAPVTKTIGASGFGSLNYNQACSPSLTFLTPTLAAFVMQDVSLNIQLYAISLNADRTVNSVSNATQLSTGITARYPMILKLDSTHVVVRWWDNTNTRNVFCDVPITGGNPPTIGTPGALTNDSTVTSTDRIQASLCGITMDSSTGFWALGNTVDALSTMAYYFTISGTTITLAASNKFNTSTQFNGGAVGRQGLRTAAGKLLTGLMPSALSTVAQAQLLSYSAGVISISWSTPIPSIYDPSNNYAGGLVALDIDLNAGLVAFTFGNATTTIWGMVVAKMNLSTGAIFYAYPVRIGFPPDFTLTPILGWNGQINSGTGVWFGDGQGIIISANSDTSAQGGITYLDLKEAVTSGPYNLTMASKTPTFSEGVVEFLKSYPAYGLFSSLILSNAAFDATTRTILVQTIPDVFAGNYSLAFNTIQIPRR